LVEWYNIKNKTIMSTKGSLEKYKSVSNCEMINTERVLGILNKSLSVLTQFNAKINILVKDLHRITELDETLNASDFLAICS
jgi:hypothetical protein